MRWLRAVVLAVSTASLAGACSSGQPVPSESSEGPVGSVAQAITVACGFDTIGLPCDPDGPGGARLECEGVCAIDKTGYATCQIVAAGTLDGIICGTKDGSGVNACKKYCSGRTCKVEFAPAGAACRPTANSNPCEGACDGSGVCNAVASACAFGRVDQLCKFETCDFAKAATCKTNNLRSGTTCSDQDACSIGKCNSGVCVAGPAAGCDDGNPCTDDECDPNDGGCSGKNDDSNSCSDFNACTSGDHCSAGACISGAGAPDCDDKNACTADSCDPNTGCAHVPQVDCNDGNACTDDTCVPANGSCSHTDKVCEDNDPCTTNGCNNGTGCTFTKLNCDDNDACTADSCSGGSCGHEDVDCDDGNVCTADSCDKLLGCAHTLIVGCGVTGEGGAGAGGEGGAGVAGTGGTVGTAGTSTGGTLGVAGASDGGAPGTAGTPGETGGAPAEAGAPSTAGSSATAGNNGTAGTDTAGTANGGATSQAGSAPTAGNATSGSATGGSSTSAGGNDTLGGAPVDGGGGSSAGSSTSGDDGGCGCRAAGAPVSNTAGLLTALVGLGIVLARRRKAA